MKKFVIVTCLWKRHELSSIVLGYYARQLGRLSGALEAMGYDVELLAVGSEGPISARIAEEAGWLYHEHENTPLSDKWNFACQKARDLGAEVLYIVGSDDLSSDAFMLKIAQMMAGGADLAGTLDCYLASPRHRRAIHILPTRHTDRAIIGAGRAVSAHACALLNWLPYEPGRAWGIDPTMDRRLAGVGVKQNEFTLGAVPGAMLLDIKTSENIWPFLFFRDMGLPADYDEPLSFFDKGLCGRFENLHDDGVHEFDEKLDPLLHRIAAAILKLMSGDDRPPTIVELGRNFELGRHLLEAIPGTSYVTKGVDDVIEPADGFVLFDSDLTLEEHLTFIRKIPHDHYLMVSVPQCHFESVEQAEQQYRELLPDFSIKIIGRWWLGCGKRRI